MWDHSKHPSNIKMLQLNCNDLMFRWACGAIMAIANKKHLGPMVTSYYPMPKSSLPPKNDIFGSAQSFEPMVQLFP